MARMGGLATLAAALWLWPAVDAGADAWPSRQVKIVVAFAPGGSADQFGRLLAAETFGRLPAAILRGEPAGE